VKVRHIKQRTVARHLATESVTIRWAADAEAAAFMRRLAANPGLVDRALRDYLKAHESGTARAADGGAK
jgi:hypothetical protein